MYSVIPDQGGSFVVHPDPKRHGTAAPNNTSPNGVRHVADMPAAATGGGFAHHAFPHLGGEPLPEMGHAATMPE